MRFSNNGLRSLIPFIFRCSFDLASIALDRFSTSPRALTHASSIAPSTIFFTTAGETLISSTIGPNPFSTIFRFSSLMLRAVDRACNVSISAETVARSFWKLVRLISTELRISSQATMDRWRSSNLFLSLSSAILDQQLHIEHGLGCTNIRQSFAYYIHAHP